jgi:hypothetical protein
LSPVPRPGLDFPSPSTTASCSRRCTWTDLLVVRGNGRVKRFRVWRLRRSYRRIAGIEVALGPCREAVDLRVNFSAQTLRMVNGVWKEQGMERGIRKAMTRRIVSATQHDIKIGDKQFRLVQ